MLINFFKGKKRWMKKIPKCKQQTNIKTGGQSLEPMKEDIKMTSGLQSTEGGEGLEREQDCVVWCLGSTGRFRFLSLLSGKEAEEVGCASSTYISTLWSAQDVFLLTNMHMC